MRGADAYANVKPLFPHATTLLMSSHKSPHSRPPPSGTCRLIQTISSLSSHVYFKLHTQNGHYSFPHSDISVPLFSSWSYGPGLLLITREQAANGLLRCSPIHHPTLLPPPRPNLPLPPPLVSMVTCSSMAGRASGRKWMRHSHWWAVLTSLLCVPLD